MTTQPSLSAAIIAALGLTGAEEVFEVGTGYGYQTALLARLAARVVSMDIWPDLAEQARRNLAAQGIGNVVVLTGDGTEGAPDLAPTSTLRRSRRLCSHARGTLEHDSHHRTQTDTCSINQTGRKITRLTGGQPQS